MHAGALFDSSLGDVRGFSPRRFRCQRATLGDAEVRGFLAFDYYSLQRGKPLFSALSGVTDDSVCQSWVYTLLIWLPY